MLCFTIIVFVVKVFDGHGGVDAALFTKKEPSEAFNGRQTLPKQHQEGDKKCLCEDRSCLSRCSFSRQIIRDNSTRCSHLGQDHAHCERRRLQSMLGKRGRAIELSKDHKPNCTSERLRIEKLGGVIYDGHLNGQLSVAQALGDWHIKGTKGSLCPLSCEPELDEIVLSEEDEYLIMGCDGLWDVISSQCAVTMVRRELMQHNDPEKCSQALVKEALQL